MSDRARLQRTPGFWLVWGLLASTGCPERRDATATATRWRIVSERTLARLDSSVEVTAAATTANGAHIAVGTADGRLAIIDEGTVRWLPANLNRPSKETPTPRTVDRPNDERSPSTRPHSQPSVERRSPIAAVAFSMGGRQLAVATNKTVRWWQLAPPRQLGSLDGRDPITALVVTTHGADKDGSPIKSPHALFATDHGHVYRWRSGSRAADVVTRFSCEVMHVTPGRRHLPAARRCPYGSYEETDAGRGYCAYPVTHLVQRGARVARACRTGTVGVLDLNTRRLRFFHGGALGALGFASNSVMVAARADRSLLLYDTDKRKRTRRIALTVRPRALASSGSLTALASGRSLLIYDLSSKADEPVSRRELGAPIIWLSWSPSATPTATKRALRALLADGRLQLVLLAGTGS